MIVAASAGASMLERIRDSYDLVSELGLPNIKSEYWSQLLEKGRQEHGGKGDFVHHEKDDELWANFRSNVVSKGLDNSNIPPERLEEIHEKWRVMHSRLSDEVAERFRPFLEESPVGNPRRLMIDGVPMSQSSIEYSYMLTHLEPYVASEGVSVDIGGGYGGMSRHLKMAFPGLKIVIFDLPEVNAIQTYFLSECFPGARFLTLRDVHELTTIDPNELDFDFLILPGQLISKLAPRSVELTINTRSMMEMNLETVSFYIENIHRVLRSGGSFYCLNRYEKKTRLKDYPFDERWFVSYSAPWPTFIDQNPHHELIAVRTAHPVLQGLKEHASGLPPEERSGSALGRISKKLGF